MNSLKILQTLSKIGKILSRIICICCIVGFFGCIVGIFAMFIGGEAVKIGGVTLYSILETEAGVSVGTVWAAIGMGIILSVGEFFVARIACRYFDHELTSGTPFTLSGAKELLHLGISTIWIPIVSGVLAQICQGVIGQLMEIGKPIELESFDSVALGITFIVMSVLCRYGAERTEGVEAE